MKTQYDRIAAMLTRPGGATSIELSRAAPSLSIHKRLSEMRRDKGWKITSRKDGKVNRYSGKPPRKLADYIPKTVWQKSLAR